MKVDKSELLAAEKELEDLLKSYGNGELYDIYAMQGMNGIMMALDLNMVSKDVYNDIWGFIKENKSRLKFNYPIPKDII